MRRLLEPLRRADRTSLVGVFGGLVLLTVYLYPGSHTFFTRHVTSVFPGAATGGLFAEWYAHGYQFATAFLLLACAPVLWLRFGARRPLADCGVALGDWRFGLRFAMVAMVILGPLLYVNAGGADFQAEYPLAKMASRSVGLFVLWELCYLVYYIGWEVFFRGFWQLGLRHGLGDFGALGLQTAVSTVMHIGKPAGETFGAIIGGVAFGLVALRTRSVLYVLLVHWYLGVMTDLFSALRAGRWG